ncbi:acyltransferase family protein [Nocardioides ginkgobilobae]
MASGFRGDVQGLRAVAVLVVVAAHAGVPLLPGGFVGVDVFFVISGFLISGLLYAELREGGTLSLGDFWSRRARRILPAATLVLVVTVVMSLFWTTLIDARDLLDEAVWSALFLANVHAAQQGVYYFAAETGPSPLQHYWSLAVEEQFYLVWPLLLLALVAAARVVTRRGKQQRLPRRTVLVALVVVAAASFAWSVHTTATSPAAAYFSTPARVWELAVGAITALVAPLVAPRLPRAVGWVLSVGGLVAVAAAVVVIDETTPFPGYAAALPVLGTAAVLLAGSGAGLLAAPVRWLLENPVMRRVGDWSYSLYLWHWPALVLTERNAGRPLTAVETAVVVLVVVNLAALTYRFVEQPFRTGAPARRLRSRRRLSLALYPASLAVVALACAGSWWWTGVQGGERGDNPAIAVAADVAALDDHERTVALVRASVEAARNQVDVPSDLTPDLLNLRSSIADVGACDYEDDDVRALCARGDVDGERTLVLLGDSHARAWIPALDRIATDHGWRAYYLVKPQCPAAHVVVAPVREDVVFTACEEFRAWSTATVAGLRPDLAIVASSPPVNGVWVDGEHRESLDDVADVLEEGYDALFDDLQDSADRTVLIRDVPKAGHDPGDCLTSSRPSLLDCMFTPVERSTLLGDVAVKSALLHSADVVDPTPWLCWQDLCPVVIGGTLSYRDTDHLTTEYAAALAGALGRALGLDDGS